MFILQNKINFGLLHGPPLWRGLPVVSDGGQPGTLCYDSPRGSLARCLSLLHPKECLTLRGTL